MKLYTDYPIEELGDIPGEEAPVRECVLTGYDHDKYVNVTVGGVEASFKRGYLYVGEGRYGEHPCLSHDDAVRLVAQ